jgi:ElaB/YqjD/DUF883 family membrane-anchored ribosome-binding protein
MNDLATRLSSALGETSGDVADEMKKQMQKISDNIDEAISQTQSTGREVAKQAKAGFDNVGETVENSIREHPYTTLAIAIGVGALVGSQLRR